MAEIDIEINLDNWLSDCLRLPMIGVSSELSLDHCQHWSIPGVGNHFFSKESPGGEFGL